MERLTGVKASIYDQTLAQLQRLSIQKTLLVDDGVRHYASAQQLVLLSTVHTALNEQKIPDGSLFFMDIELKAYLPNPTKAAVGTAVARNVRALAMEDHCVVSSFNDITLYAAKAEHPDLRTAIAYDDTLPISNSSSVRYWIYRSALNKMAIVSLDK